MNMSLKVDKLIPSESAEAYKRLLRYDKIRYGRLACA